MTIMVVARLLFIDVMDSALKWDRCAKEYCWDKANKEIHEGLGVLGREMFGNFPGNNEIRLPTNMECVCQFNSQEILSRDLKHRSIDTIAIQSQDI